MKKPLRQVYTPRNIYWEIMNRLAKKARQTGMSIVENASYDSGHAENVGAFYDRHHDKFMAVYGPVIQAFRTKDIHDLLDYQIDSIGLYDGLKVLDAGCGTAAPAVYFAGRRKLMIDAVTISELQWRTALQNVEAANLSDRIKVFRGDYHCLTDIVGPGQYDVVYFLESFGHSRSKKRLIDVVWDVLKPGGVLYIKDLFGKVPVQAAHKKKIDAEIKKINAAYCYEVAELNTVLDYVRAKGFILSSLKTVDLSLEAFEDLAISNEFQELTGIALIRDWGEYVFPVDFFELKCTKPPFDLNVRPDRYFLQNLYHAKNEGKHG